jgi:hemin uptake protein HemP
MRAPSLQPGSRAEEADKSELPTVTSEELLRGRRQLIIEHGEERYRLLVTRSNKLILTK